MFKKLGKHKSPGLQRASSSLNLVPEEQPPEAGTPNPMPSLARDPLADRSVTEASSLIAHNLATSGEASTSNVTPSRLETAPTSRSVAKDHTAVNAIKLLLDIASNIPGPGVKTALAGLLKIIEKVQVRR